MKRVILMTLSVIFALNYYSFGQILVPHQEGSSGKWGFLDEKTGKLIIPHKYDVADGFVEGLAAVGVRYEGWGFIDKTGNEVIPIKYDWVDHFADGLAKATLNGKTGFIDRTGETVIPFKYDFAKGFAYGDFREEFSLVRLDGKYGYIDKTGVEVVPVKYTTEKAMRKLLKSSRKSIAKL